MTKLFEYARVHLRIWCWILPVFVVSHILTKMSGNWGKINGVPCKFFKISSDKAFVWFIEGESKRGCAND